jgi:hypothetical protein
MQLRTILINEMLRHEAEQREIFKWAAREFYAPYCTWWFIRKLDLGLVTTAMVRHELTLMEKDGLVIANRSQKNNTKWMLVSAPEGDKQ